MSYEAWGDDDDGPDYSRLLDAGWWDGDQTQQVVEAVKALRAEPLYEGGQMALGVSARFLMRMTLLAEAVNILRSDDALVKEARAALTPEDR